MFECIVKNSCKQIYFDKDERVSSRGGFLILVLLTKVYVMRDFTLLLLIDYLSDNTNVRSALSKSVLFSQQQKLHHTPII